MTTNGKFIVAGLAALATFSFGSPTFAAKTFTDSQVTPYGYDDVRLTPSLDSGQHAVITLAENSGYHLDVHGNLVVESSIAAFSGDGYTYDFGGTYPTTYDMSQEYYMGSRRYPSGSTCYYEYTCTLSKSGVQGDTLPAGIFSYSVP